jgi:hypothetical protein
VKQAWAAASLLLLAGCLEAGETPAGAEDEPDEDGPGRVSKWSDSKQNGTRDPPHTLLTLLETPIQLVGSASQSFTVAVPENVTNVDFAVTSANPAWHQTSTEVSLSGCGTWSSGLGSYTSIGGGARMDGRICAAPGAGSQTLVVSNTGFIDGLLKVTAQDPIENGTASP